MNVLKGFKILFIALIILIVSVFGYYFLSGQKNHKFNQENTFVPKDPAFYNKSTSFQRFLSWSNEKEMLAKDILKIIGERNGSLLDIGAGNGQLTEKLKNNFARVVVVEPSTTLFAELKEKFPSNKFALINSSFEKVNVKEKFDVILASHSFHYIENHQKEMSRIKDQLKDKGVFLLVTLRPCAMWDFFNKYKEDVLGEKPDGDPSGFNYNIKNMLEKFFDVEEVTSNARATIPSVEDAVNILDFLYNIEFSKIKKETLLKIRNDLSKTYGKGPVVLDIVQGIYICRKQ